MFRIPKRKDILPVVVVVVLQIIYSLAVIFLLSALGLSEHTPSEDTVVSVIIIIAMIIQVLGEELFKIILLILVMTVLYRFLNRKLSIVISSLAVVFTFGFIHAGFYGGILNVILVQGFGSLFNLYLYIKTKNVAVSYTGHVLYDFILMFPSLILS